MYPVEHINQQGENTHSAHQAPPQASDCTQHDRHVLGTDRIVFLNLREGLRAHEKPSSVGFVTPIIPDRLNVHL